MPLALPALSVRRKRHESAMNRVRGRGVSNGSAASCKHESHEVLSHASSTTEIKLVAHPVGEPSPQRGAGSRLLLGPTQRTQPFCFLAGFREDCSQKQC